MANSISMDEHTGMDYATETIWTSLPGRYRFLRRRHHEQTIDGRLYLPHQLINPSHGSSEITTRQTTDTAYERELLFTSTFFLQTVDGHKISLTYAIVLRMKESRVSVWHTNPDNGHTIHTKLTDVDATSLTSRRELDSHSQLQASWLSSEFPWRTLKGEEYLSFQFYIGYLNHFQVDHFLDMGQGRTSLQSDEYFRLMEQ